MTAKNADINSPYRSESAAKEDRDILASREKQYDSEARNRFLYGSIPSNAYAGDKAHQELKEEIERRRKDESMYRK